VIVAARYCMGRNPIRECGEIEFWIGALHGPDNSQHLADWYTPGHIIHGFLFAGWAGSSCGLAP